VSAAVRSRLYAPIIASGTHELAVDWPDTSTLAVGTAVADPGATVPNWVSVWQAAKIKAIGASQTNFDIGAPSALGPGRV